MTTSPHDSALIQQVETRIDRLSALHGTLLRCIGALGSNTDAASHLACEALQHAADELDEIIHDIRVSTPPRRYRHAEKHPADIE
ncbi:MAG: hypothetical protein WAW42_06145 [Candidatus Competibacteraceae bacterium]